MVHHVQTEHGILVADGHHIQLRAEEALLDEGAENEATDATETIDCDFDCHGRTLWLMSVGLLT